MGHTGNTMGNLARFGVSLDEDLLEPFDQLCKRKSYPNRSEAIRDLIRKALVEERWSNDASGAGTLTLTAVNGFTGGTTVNGGLLNITGQSGGDGGLRGCLRGDQAGAFGRLGRPGPERKVNILGEHPIPAGETAHSEQASALPRME